MNPVSRFVFSNLLSWVYFAITRNTCCFEFCFHIFNLELINKIPSIELGLSLGQKFVYSLSINSLTLGGSGANPFRFLISATISVNLDLGSSPHCLKCVFHMAFPAVCPVLSAAAFAEPVATNALHPDGIQDGRWVP